MTTLEIMQKCKQAAEIASRSTLDQLEAHGPKYTVHNADLFNNKGPVIGTMLDVCGNAYVTIPGNCAFTRELKKLGKFERDIHSGEFWSIRKSAYKGYILSIDYLQRQEYSVNVAAVEAIALVLSENEIRAEVTKYID
jgi:hypothetical protein